MFETIVEFLSTRHGHRGTYGWTYILLAALALYGAFAARDHRAKKKRLLTETAELIATEAREASILVNDEKTSRLVVGKIRWQEDSYVLSLRTDVGSMHKESMHRFITIAALETFLRTQTPLRLSDFRTQRN